MSSFNNPIIELKNGDMEHVTNIYEAEKVISDILGDVFLERLHSVISDDTQSELELRISEYENLCDDVDVELSDIKKIDDKEKRDAKIDKLRIRLHI